MTQQRIWEVVISGLGGIDKVQVTYPERWTERDVRTAVANSYASKVLSAAPVGRSN